MGVAAYSKVVDRSWFLDCKAEKRIRFLFFVIKETRSVSFLLVKPERERFLGRLESLLLLPSSATVLKSVVQQNCWTVYLGDWVLLR